MMHLGTSGVNGPIFTVMNCRPGRHTEHLQCVLHNLGDVVHLEALGQHIIILSLPEACDELLIKRGATYSDRPAFTMATL